MAQYWQEYCVNLFSFISVILHHRLLCPLSDTGQCLPTFLVASFDIMHLATKNVPMQNFNSAPAETPWSTLISGKLAFPVTNFLHLKKKKSSHKSSTYTFEGITLNDYLNQLLELASIYSSLHNLNSIKMKHSETNIFWWITLLIHKILLLVHSIAT